MRDAKEVEAKLIQLRQGDIDYTYPELATLIGRSEAYVKQKIFILIKNGIIEPTKKGPKPKKVIVKPLITEVKPVDLGCGCSYPFCTFAARFTFSLVPLCPSHYEVIKDESDLYYSAEEDSSKIKRTHWERISKRSAELWANQRANTFIQTKSYQRN